MNLLHNIIQYNEGGCRIEMKLHQDRKNHVFLELSSTGTEVSKEFLSRLNSGSYVWESGIGQHDFGLEIIRQVTDWHHWKLFFVNGEQRGLVRTIWLR